MNSILKAIVALLIVGMIGIGFGTAVDVPTFSYTSYTDRPGNFAMTDTATCSGYNSFQASTLANAGGVDEMTKVNTLPAHPGAAPDEKSYQNVYMEFFKDGTTVDPAVQETITSDITVGTLSDSVVPTFDKDGNLVTTKMGEGYDLATMTVGGIAGTPIVTNGVLTGITNDYQRYVFGSVQSYQDDYIKATGADSAGNLDAWGNPSDVLSSYTTAQVGSPTMPENTPYVKFDWTDLRGYRVDVNKVAWSGIADFTIQNSINYEQILPGDYRSGAYL